jgi:hypothetical protein
MTTIWTNEAILSLKRHYDYFKKTKGTPEARAWRKAIFDKVDY